MCPDPIYKGKREFKKTEEITSPEVLVLLSGGLDSAACLSFYKCLNRPTCGLFIDYEQPAANHEYRAAKEIANYYNVFLYTAKWNGQSKKRSGIVAARNAFLLIAALMERPEQVTTIALGIHAGTQYTDCSSEFVSRMQSIFDIYSEGALHIATPFKDWTKSDIWAYAISKNVPVDLTYSCEAGLNQPCGKCLSCLDRKGLEAYA
jgi:7-cyano-7-deazaguanine synthase